MDREELEELQKLASPALHHAELVELAKKHSPTKAQEIASGRWPRRQARACRFLAVMRRDFPEAFKVFIVHHPSEQARPACSVQSALEENNHGSKKSKR